MSVKSQAHINLYTAQVCELQGAIANLAEFVDTLPGPDANNELPSPFHYGHTASVARLHELIAEAIKIADSFDE
jgi:hypothetical protein